MTQICVPLVVVSALLLQTDAFFLKGLFLKPFLHMMQPTTTPDSTTSAYTYPPAPVYPAMPSGYPAFPVFQMSYGGYGGGGGGGGYGGGGSYNPPPYNPPSYNPPPYVAPPSYNPPPYVPPPPPPCPPSYDQSAYSGSFNGLSGLSGLSGAGAGAGSLSGSVPGSLSGSGLSGVGGLSGLPPAPTYELVSGTNQGFSSVSASNLALPSSGGSRNDLDQNSLDWPRVDPRKLTKDGV